MSIILDTRGFRGINNNCFINTLMVSMFCYRKSPFFSIKIKNEKQGYLYNYMMNLVYQMENNAIPDCTPLRRVLLREMQYGQQDTSETYDYLMKLLEFEPITITTKKCYRKESGELKECN